MYRGFPMPNFFLCITTSLVIICGGCSAEEYKASAANTSGIANREVSSAAPASAIEIKPGSPADTVRAFYTKLREKKFREAIFLTNLRPAVEGLTDAELREFQVDFEVIASKVPAVLTINGEIVSGEKATVTASLPGDDPEKLETQQLELRKEGDVWIILTVDQAAEARIKREGKNYFFALKIETHEDEARDMLDRIAKAQLAYAMQNGGKFTGIDQLVAAELLPDDVKTSASTGYNYSVTLTADKQIWTAHATPAVYGKTGKLSFFLTSDGKSTPRISSKDNGGKPLAN